MRGQIGALVGADAFAPFGGELAADPEQARHDDDGEAEREQLERPERVLQLVHQRPGDRPARDEVDRDEHGREADEHAEGVAAHREPAQAHGAAARRAEQPAEPVGLVEPAPGERERGLDGQQRDDDRIGQRPAERTGGEHDAELEGEHADRAADAVAVGAGEPAPRAHGAAAEAQVPKRIRERERRCGKRGADERQPHDRRIELQEAGGACRNAQEQVVVAAEVAGRGDVRECSSRQHAPARPPRPSGTPPMALRPIPQAGVPAGLRVRGVSGSFRMAAAAAGAPSIAGMSSPQPDPAAGPAEAVGTSPPLRRSSTDRVFAGVCGGVARRFGVPALAVRVAFSVLALTGMGVAVYVVIAIACPATTTRGRRASCASSLRSWPVFSRSRSRRGSCTRSASAATRSAGVARCF